MKKSIRRILSSVVILVSIFLLFISIIVFSGSWLMSGADSPVRADAIVILAGEPTRAFYAADLYMQGYAPKVYVSKPIRLPTQILLDELGVFTPRGEEINRQVLLKKGVSDKDIYIFGKSSLSTIEEAEGLNKLFADKKYHLLIVTSPYHIKRTKIILREKIKNCTISVVPTSYEKIPKKWWTAQNSAVAVILELTKILFYKFGGGFHSSGGD